MTILGMKRQEGRRSSITIHKSEPTEQILLLLKVLVHAIWTAGSNMLAYILTVSIT
jgi:hypothetical protein